MQVSLNLNENEYNKLLKNDRQSVIKFTNEVKDKITAATKSKHNKNVKVTIVLEDQNNE